LKVSAIGMKDESTNRAKRVVTLFYSA